MFNGNLRHFVSEKICFARRMETGKVVFMHFSRWQSDTLFSLSVRVQIMLFLQNSRKMHGALKTCLIYKGRKTKP